MSAFFLTIVNMSISASWIVLAVLLLRFLLKKAPKWIMVLLWGIVAIRLICPVSIESVMSLIPSAQTINPEIMLEAAPEITPGVTPGFTPGATPGTDFQLPTVNNTVTPGISEPLTPEPGISTNPVQIWISILSVVWLGGMAVMLAYTGISYFRVKKKIGTAVLLQENIFQSETVASPFVLGVIKPKIYLPFHINAQDMQYVIAHENAHIRRKDHLWKPIGFLILTLHWFNPLMWLGYVLLCRDIELACDEKVIKALNAEQKADYSQALLTCSVNRRMIAACPLAFGEIGVKNRVKSVLNYKKPAFWIILVAIIASVAVAVCFLTDPITVDKPSSSDVEEAYKSLLEDLKAEQKDLYYSIKDIDGNDVDDLILLENTKLSIYTFENSMNFIGEHDFLTGTARFCYSDKANFPGIFYYTAGGGADHYGYLTIQDGTLLLTDLWEEMPEGASGIKELSSNKDLISESKKVFENNCDIKFTPLNEKDTSPMDYFIASCNMNSGGYVNFLNGNYYYLDTENRNSLYMCDADGKNAVCIDNCTDATLSHISVSETAVYYLKRTKLDTPLVFADFSVDYSIVYDGQLRRFYDGKVTVLSEENVVDYALSKEYIFYTTADQKVYRMKHDGTEKTAIIDFTYPNICTSENKLYTHMGEGVCSTDFDGKNRLTVRAYHFELAASESAVYFISADDCSLNKMSLNGETISKVISDPIRSFTVYNGRLVYERMYTDDIVIADMDGSNPQVVCTGASPISLNGHLFYLDNGVIRVADIPNGNQTDKDAVDIASLPLQEAYAYAVKQYQEHPELHRDLCELQSETQQIIEMGGKFYQSYVAANVDMRYVFISQPEFPDERAALWDWYPVGTTDNYSLDLLGKINDGQSNSQPQPKIPDAFAAILDNTQSFYKRNQQEMTLSDYHKTIWGFTAVDMDADGSNELAVMFTDGTILLLRQQNDAVYGYDFGLHAMYQVYTDGTFLWNSDAGNIYGCSKLQFTGNNCETVELWRVEQDASGSFTYYIDNKPVSKEQYDSQQTNSESVVWNPWRDMP